MIEIDIPGVGQVKLEKLLLDYNGTLALDGTPLEGVRERLERLQAQLELYLVTADTFGTVREEMAGSGVELLVLESDDHTGEKRELLERLGAECTVAIGNGNNDRLMLEASVLGMAVLGPEGCAADTLRSADLLCASIGDALDLLLHPRRLVATLRR
jgi:soluble P-type ATPase